MPDDTKLVTARSGYDTNLAAEFYVLSCLHRIGLTANLTLGNKTRRAWTSWSRGRLATP